MSPVMFVLSSQHGTGQLNRTGGFSQSKYLRCRNCCRKRKEYAFQRIVSNSKKDRDKYSAKISVAKKQTDPKRNLFREEKVEDSSMEPITPRWTPNRFVVGIAGIAVIAAIGYAGLKKLQQRRKHLLQSFAVELLRYGWTELEIVDTVEDYKGKLELMFCKPQLYEEFFVSLLKERALSLKVLEDTYTVFKSLGLSYNDLVKVCNRSSQRLKTYPSALDKLLFISERLIPRQYQSQLKIIHLFPYPESTVRDLQHSLAEKCFLEVLKTEKQPIESLPLDKAEFLGIPKDEAQSLYDQYRLQEIQQKQYSSKAVKDKTTTIDASIEEALDVKEEQSTLLATRVLARRMPISVRIVDILCFLLQDENSSFLEILLFVHNAKHQRASSSIYRKMKIPIP
eukprot:ctg_84.g46